MNTYTVRIGIETEAVERHINFYTFSVEYIFCTYPPPKPKKSVTELELEKH